ncbi:hypothetical protein E308F_00900 [Moorella sp. E308F]|uniref:DUF3796 domain-containing protein n=1 Tax=unclassified Neomoorella TaxID=2676739 RepID=UPI0010FFC083|nr:MULTISPECIES: DUF3796 domain-containing protein [unclassified Moorella (in: firmicutes)]GEA13850.1 hypothetical protein E308F_00900 [Moorella sp. E308F]GEA18778.1 hypothetical protein E306M_19150 [Moorella sp. E306M]
MKNKLGYLSLLAVLGTLGFLTDNKAYLGFWGFLYYIRYFFVIPDELFKANVQKAATPAFFTGLASSAVTIMLRVLMNNDALPTLGMGLGMALSIFVFTVILMVCEIRESGSSL